MHAFLAAAWPYLLAFGTAVAGVAIARLKVWRASPAAAAHPLEASVADVAIAVANDALALLRSNPTLTPAGVVAWAKQELQAQAPAAVVTVGDAAAAAAFSELVRKSLLSVAQGGSLDAAATAIIAAMAPTAATAKISPPQIAAVLADATAAAPDLEAAIAAKLPDIVAAVMKELNGGAAPAPAVATEPTNLVGPTAPAAA